MSNKKRSNWVHAGKDLEADVFVNLDTGETKHIGTKVTDGNSPQVYDGPPSKLGYIAGKAVQAMLGKTRRD
jgi:hypothetical protein